MIKSNFLIENYLKLKMFYLLFFIKILTEKTKYKPDDKFLKFLYFFRKDMKLIFEDNKFLKKQLNLKISDYLESDEYKDILLICYYNKFVDIIIKNDHKIKICYKLTSLGNKFIVDLDLNYQDELRENIINISKYKSYSEKKLYNLTANIIDNFNKGREL